MPLFLNSQQIKTPLSRSKTSCEKCGLYRKCLSPKMPATGKGEKGIFILAEAPGEQEDARGKQLIGQAGQLLRSHLESLDIDLDRDCRKMNAVNCRPPGNETPTPMQVSCCRPMVMQEIEAFKPKIVIALGSTAMECLLGGLSVEDDGGGITLWRGWGIPDQRLGCWLCPTFHPSFINRHRNQEDAVEKIFHTDLSHALDHLAMRFPKIMEQVDSYLEYDLKDDDVIDRIRAACKAPVAAFDYETTALKPQRQGHAIAYASICDKWNHSFSFMPNETTTPYLKRFLSSQAEKYAANMAFEDTWSIEILKTQVENWNLDTVLAAHIMDNRSSSSNLKFQTYVNFGIPDYSKDVEHYLKGRNSNDFNKVFSAPKRLMYKYNAQDSLFTFWLALNQKEHVHAVH